jgi:enoyl-CoA hydratase/carnithine racemase
MHILMGTTLSPRDAERKGLVHETVNGKALDRAMEIASHLAKHTPDSVRAHQAPHPQRDRDAARAGPRRRTQPLPETGHQRTRPRPHARVRSAERHRAVARQA